ncbi:MAG TPA: amidophosphoribosyltransferase [Nevskiaceae bacterium]|nr:amidophosphoribosyltransferase [Nevskiaceae bacterium]
MSFSFPSDSSQIREKCAVFGAYNVGPQASRLTFYGLWALQHRGQESSGIVSSDGHNLYRHTAPGLVANVYHEEDLEQLPGHIAIGHNRYSTSGAAEGAHSQPVLKREHKLAFAHNGNLPVTDALAAFLDEHDIAHQKYNDSEMMAEAINCLMENGMELEAAIQETYPLFTGAFSSVAMTNKKLVAFRDECGIRPLSIGRLGKGYVVASETCAFDTVGATFIRDVQPGELVIIDEHGITSHQAAKPRPKLDMFELVYFARPDSIIQGLSVDQVRQNFGQVLAEEYKLDADIVVPVPDSSIPAAIGYARASDIPFEMALIKNRYIHRTFIRPSAKLREQDLRMKLNPMPHLLKGKRVVLIDDSIVRGTTTRKIVRMLQEAGAREVHVLISSPPVRYPDFYGINISDQHELIAAQMSVEEIRQHIGADTLGYLSFNGMIRATGQPASTFCTSCFDGIYPIAIGKQAKKIAHVGA